MVEARSNKSAHKPRKRRQHFLIEKFPELKPPDPKTVPPDETSLARQNKAADKYGLPRIQNSEELAAAKESGYLAPLDARYDCFAVDQRLAKRRFTVLIPDPKNPKKKKRVARVEDFRYLHPDDIDYFNRRLTPRYCTSDPAQGHRPFMFSSLVRTQEFQKWLCSRYGGKNPNACQAIGDADEDRSCHTTGYCFDISALGHTNEELIELARLLLEDKASGYLVEIIFEPKKNDFHIMVHPRSGWPTNDSCGLGL